MFFFIIFLLFSCLINPSPVQLFSPTNPPLKLPTFFTHSLSISKHTPVPLPVYDYIIVGGGTSGLVLASRLTQNPSITVLVIEAGPLIPTSGPATEEVLTPGLTWSIPQQAHYRWGITSLPNKYLGNKQFNVTLAKVVGGGSAINGMFFTRGSRTDYDAWEALGNPGWGWEGMEEWFKKSESFHKPAKDFGIGYDDEAHGKKGLINSAYPNFIYPQTKIVYDAMKIFGIPSPQDCSDGTGVGNCWVTNTLDPRKQTRSYARTGYYDVAKEWPNLHLLTDNQVLKILFNKNKRATGVLYAPNPTHTSQTVYCRREIILAAGAIHTPRLLLLSGVGPPALLCNLPIPIVAPLPGVGANLQDHPSVWSTPFYSITLPPQFPDPAWMKNATYAAERLAEYRENRTGPMTVSFGNHASFLPLPLITPSLYKALIEEARKNPIASSLHTDDPTVVAGYQKQRELLLSSFSTNKTATNELVIGPEMAPRVFNLLHPLSRGFVSISSADPWKKPVVDYRTFSDPLDLKILVQMMGFVRRFMKSEGMAIFNPIEVSPGGKVKGERELEELMKMSAFPGTDHQCGTAAMMPQEMGGVVDARLRVYGTKGLRVVDSSVIPVIQGGHLVAGVYAVAEKASDIIKADNAGDTSCSGAHC
ncbi:hypothetical protein FPQ18DRAFT_294584 [Pyronema domesticum]|nr:hypothetical protein FPQ18DRAFT_294584 [Pyronema domesticum]